MLKQLTVIRSWLFIILLAGAPFTFNPSLSLPTSGFVSFRLGLYQLCVVIFAALMLPLIWQARAWLLRDKWVSAPAGVLSLVIISSPFRSVALSGVWRSLLLSSSILLLVLLLLSGIVFMKSSWNAQLGSRLVKYIIAVGFVVGVFALIQFIANSFAESTLGLCANCGASVFGFPRINGFSAEPQFMASAFLPAILLAYIRFVQTKQLKLLSMYGFLVFVLFLTLSRGGFIAIFAGVIAATLALYMQKKTIMRPVLISGIVTLVAVVLGIGAMIASATVQHQSQNQSVESATAATVIEQVSNGVVDLPFNDPKPTNNTPAPTQSFQSPGVIEASAGDRQTAASHGLRWWHKDLPTLIFGLGSGNLGSYAHAQNAQVFSLSFTIYMQYIFMLVELGVVGLMAFLLLLTNSIVRAFRIARANNSILFVGVAAALVAFSVQYLFFGTYINVPYVWLYMGVGLGAVYLKKKAKV